MSSDPMVSCVWLAERLDAPDVRVVDATWFMPGDPRDAKALHAERRIPGAVFFDIDEIADTASTLPHMLPSAEKFASRMRKLGIGDGARVVVYDQQGIRSAPRVWWTFRVMGCDDVSVLDGGLAAWDRLGLPVEQSPPHALPERHFTARMRTDLVRDLADMRRTVAQRPSSVLDARSSARFKGDTPEPRVGLKRGHMPGALNIPFEALLTAEGLLKTREELAAVFAEAGADLSHGAVCSCGSGITAAIIALALARLGKWDAAIYDGSWTEWGGRDDTPIASGG